MKCVCLYIKNVYGEKKQQHFDLCGWHIDKTTFYFGGIGQFTDTI